MLRLTVVVTLLVQLAAAYLSEQPKFVNTCLIKDENFEKCSTAAVQKLFDEITKGLPAIDLELLDPLWVPQIKILQGGGPVSVNASLTNVTVLGFGDTHVVTNRVDPVTYDFHTKIKLPRLRIDGQYILVGRILVIPLRGHGKCWFEAKDLDIAINSDVTLEKRDNFHFFNISRCHVKFNIGGLRLYLGNLFDGIKALEETTNAYLNANWRPVADSLNPILAKTIEDIMSGILQKVFNNIPANYFIGDLEA